ncbi:MAG TPA: hypothetical protein PKO09_09500 [Anaerolineae bacterium]|nr:hypothetical protein [Anaerolineae bacterium]
MSHRNVRIGFPSGQIVLILMGILVLYLAVDFGRQVIISQQRRNELRAVQAQIADGERRHEALLAELEYNESDAAAEAWARDQGWVKTGEVPVVIVAPHTEVEASQVSAEVGFPAGTVLREWWELFFGFR